MFHTAERHRVGEVELPLLACSRPPPERNWPSPLIEKPYTTSCPVYKRGNIEARSGGCEPPEPFSIQDDFTAAFPMFTRASLVSVLSTLVAVAPSVRLRQRNLASFRSKNPNWLVKGLGRPRKYGRARSQGLIQPKASRRETGRPGTSGPSVGIGHSPDRAHLELKRVEQYARVFHRAGAHCQRWHSQPPRFRLTQGQVFVRSEEEGAIALNRSATAATKVAYPQFAAREPGTIGATSRRRSAAHAGNSREQRTA